MKPLVFLLLLCSNMYAFTAAAAGDYEIVVSSVLTGGSTGTPTGKYECRLKDIPPSKWAKYDLITWIFPDGQYRQTEELVGDLTNASLSVFWEPYLKPVAGDSIIAYVAKKGKPGNPARVAFGASGVVDVVTATAPAAFFFPQGRNWQLNRSWAFSEGSDGNETFLVFSYDPAGCSTSPPTFTSSAPTDYLDMYFDQDQMYHTEIKPFSAGVVNTLTSGTYTIPQLSTVPFYKHVFFKMRLDPDVNLGDPIKIRVKGQVCSIAFDSTFSYLVEADPHDPNQKIVDIDTIDANGPAVRLNYTVQYHNDGKAPVNTVRVNDMFPGQLDPSTFMFTSMPLKSAATFTWSFPVQNQLSVLFENMDLPGLNQSGPSYGYDQTIFRFSFQVFTKPNLNITFPNSAVITFYGTQGGALDPIITEPALVYTVSPKEDCGFCCCLKKWFRRKR